MSRIILASTSPTRRRLLADAGLAFEAMAPGVDEEAVVELARREGSALEPADTADILARLKAEAVSSAHPDAIVIGCDQTLDLDGELLTKAPDMDALRRKLLRLRGRRHMLHAAVACAKGGETIWEQRDSAALTMREFTPEFLGHYLAGEGDDLLGSVGGYRLEGAGVQLFNSIEGSYFTILGLPLLPLLAWLRTQEYLEE
ncbi:MAG: septum formation protein Maf [Rhodobiaceae bacterium]|nr:septum formation protein Maf [Rhodobiaceae bacterium]MCC0055441.1 septum formation protein Maf [Rhodobiaceae bacterium]